MKISGWHLLRLVAEARLDLVGAVIESNRFDASTNRFLFILGSPRGKRYLIVGTRGTRPALLWTHRKTEIESVDRFKPTERLNRLRGARLTAVSLPQPDRWICCDFTKRDKDSSGTRSLALILSWLGSKGNLRLLDAGTDLILETAWPESPSQVGNQFEPPRPPTLIDWRDLTFPEYEEIRESSPDQTIAELVARKLWGIDSVLAGQVEDRVVEAVGAISDRSRTRILWSEFEAVIHCLRGAVDPATPLYLPKSSQEYESLVLLPPAPDAAALEEYPSLTSLMAAVDVSATRESTLTTVREHLVDSSRQAIRTLDRRIASLRKAAERGETSDQMQREADLLGANRHLIRRGMVEITLDDWETGSKITVDLDAKKSPQENIDAAYRRVRTAIRAAEHAAVELPDLVAQRERAQMDLENAEQSDPDPEQLEQFESELADGKRGRGSPSQSAPRLPYREFALGEDRVLVGRSRRDNDELTLRRARPTDLFLHAQGVPGSHVILRSRDRKAEFDKRIIQRAAQIAAYFSRAKHSGLVPVSYTEVRYVRKPRRAPAGLVRLEREQTVMVEPSPPPGYHEGGEKNR